MLKIEKPEVVGWEAAIRGMRNPLNSWDRSDSGVKCPYKKDNCCGECQQNFCIGPNDKKLMSTLRNAGTDHRKFMRMITVYLDITAPLYWWKEFKTYDIMKSIFQLDEVMNMGNIRDDFTSATKELLANRVGRRCSNPACRKLTCGANTNPEKVTNIGVAAHICAAAQGGPRYDASMTPEERKSFENGIWLCQSCSKLIDTDITRYPKELLQSWKQLAEQTAILEVETTSSTPAFEKDKELVQFYLECFDRPAFQDDIYQEGRMEDFDKAIEDTLIALNTGVLRTRDGSILKQADGKSSVQNSLWREKLYTITDMLTAIRRRLKIAKKEKAYSTYGTGEDVAYCFYDRELAEWLNSTREEILKILSSICKEAGLRELHFRKHRYRW